MLLPFADVADFDYFADFTDFGKTPPLIIKFSLSELSYSELSFSELSFSERVSLYFQKICHLRLKVMKNTRKNLIVSRYLKPTVTQPP